MHLPTKPNAKSISQRPNLTKKKRKRDKELYEREASMYWMKSHTDWRFAWRTELRTYTHVHISIRTYRGAGWRSDADGTRVIRYNRIMRAAICGRKSGRVRGQSTQCFAARPRVRVLDYKLHRPQPLLSLGNDTLVSLSSGEIIAAILASLRAS